MEHLNQPLILRLNAAPGASGFTIEAARFWRWIVPAVLGALASAWLILGPERRLIVPFGGVLSLYRTMFAALIRRNWPQE